MSEEYFLVVTYPGLRWPDGESTRVVVGARGRRVAVGTSCARCVDEVLTDRHRRRALEGWRTLRGALAELDKYRIAGSGATSNRKGYSVTVWIRTGDKLVPHEGAVAKEIQP